MNRETFERLVEGEALYFNRTPDDYPSFEAFVDNLESANELYHVVAYRWAQAFLDDMPEELTVLDAACGTGYGTSMLAKHPNVSQAIGLDLGKSALAFASAKYPHVIFYEADLTQPIDFIARGSIDMVVSFQTIEHVLDPVGFMATLHATLKEEGTMLLASPTHTKSLHFLPESNPYHLVEYNAQFLKRLCNPFFGKVLLFNELPKREVFDLLRRRIKDLKIPPANYMCLQEPKTPLPESELASFRSGILEDLYTAALKEVQRRFIEQRRKNHFLNGLWEHVELISGFYTPELKLVWTKRRAHLRLTETAGCQRIGFDVTPPAGVFANRKSYVVHITHQQTGKRSTLNFKRPYASRYEVPAIMPEHDILLEVENTFLPSDESAKDIRKLGVYLSNFIVHGEAT